MFLTRVCSSTSSIEIRWLDQHVVDGLVQLVVRHAKARGQRALRVHVHQQHAAAVLGERGAQVDRRRGFPDATLLVAHRDDLGRPMRGARLVDPGSPAAVGSGQADLDAAVRVVGHARPRRLVTGVRMDIAGKSNVCARLRWETRRQQPRSPHPAGTAEVAMVEIHGPQTAHTPISMVRLADGNPVFATINKTGQIGDDGKRAAVKYVLENARAGDLDDVLATIDRFGYEESILINVGDEKGAILDAAVRRANPTLCPGARHLRRIRRPADRQVGAQRQGVLRRTRRSQRRQRPADLGSCRGRRPRDMCRRHPSVTTDAPWTGWPTSTGSPLAHWISYFSIMTRTFTWTTCRASWPGVGCIRDRSRSPTTFRVPGAPKYRAYMREQQGKRWNTAEHKAHLEYQSLVTDLVLVSEYLG